jgi:asparagine synthase (glutamine-hydrolysing)
MGSWAFHLENDRWVERDGTHVRGRAVVDGEPLDAGALAELFARADSDQAFLAALDRANGFYAVVSETDGGARAAVDHIRSIPLYYADGYVTDSAQWLRERLDDPTVDPVAEAEYLLTMYATGSDTLYRPIQQFQAGEALLAAGSIATEWHFEHDPDGSLPGDRAALVDRLDDALVAAFERTIAVADGRPIVVPLSGGYDSRLIVLMLRRLGYDDVRAMTYGRPEASDVRVAEEIADQLDIPWHFVEYSTDKWRRWFDTPERAAYYRTVDNFDAIPNLAAWPAIWELDRRDAIPADAVFMPGQTAAGVAGHLPEWLPDRDRIALDDLVDYALDEHYSLLDWEDPELTARFRSRLRTRIGAPEFGPPAAMAAAYERWEWRERQSKYMSQDGRIYEFWGYDWWYPLFDAGFAEFWEGVPLEWRADKRLYEQYVEGLHVTVTGVDRSTAARTQNEADPLPARLLDTAKSTAADSPVAAPARSVYRWLQRQQDVRGNHPLGYLGIVPEEQFDRLYTGAESHHTFRTLETLGRISFDPPDESGYPEEVSLDALERTRPEREEDAEAPKVSADD